MRRGNAESNISIRYSRVCSPGLYCRTRDASSHCGGHDDQSACRKWGRNTSNTAEPNSAEEQKKVQQINVIMDNALSLKASQAFLPCQTGQELHSCELGPNGLRGCCEAPCHRTPYSPAAILHRVFDYRNNVRSTCGVEMLVHGTQQVAFEAGTRDT